MQESERAVTKNSHSDDSLISRNGNDRNVTTNIFFDDNNVFLFRVSNITFTVVSKVHGE